MRRLILLRHAKSDWSSPGKPDHDRPLNERGRAAAPRVGRYMVDHHLVPDRAVVSSSVRTRQTYRLVAEAFARPLKETVEPRIYEAEASTLLEVIRETPADVHTLLLVGHNPGLHDLAIALVGAGEPDARRRLREKMPTGALAAIDFATDNWREVRDGSGRLDRFVTARALVDSDD